MTLQRPPSYITGYVTGKKGALAPCGAACELWPHALQVFGLGLRLSLGLSLRLGLSLSLSLSLRLRRLV